MNRKRKYGKSFPTVKKSTFMLTVLLPFLLWWGAIYGRNTFIHPRCPAHPESCTTENIPQMDRFSVNLEDGKADLYSYYTQNTSGALALGVPVLWNAGLLLSQTLSPWTFWLSLSADLTLMGQTVAWNGLFTEISHYLTQRPRPFVYQDPPVRGAEASHYTSFYSGHTSFVAATQTALLLFLFFRGAPLWLLLLWLCFAESMVFSTAYFRVFAGRHFLTDVLAGASAGTLMALFTFFLAGRARDKAKDEF